jgi:hypothetical protein
MYGVYQKIQQELKKIIELIEKNDMKNIMILMMWLIIITSIGLVNLKGLIF